MDLELIKIFNRVRILSTNKIYKYNKQQGINSKPSLQRGNENLTEYKVDIQLHCMFCNPVKMIEKIDEYAKNRKSFDWIYHGKYMGDFVIDSVEKSIEQQIKENIIYARLRVNLVENPIDKTFKEQLIGQADISKYIQFDINSTVIQDFDKGIQNSILENIKNEILKNETEGISDKARQYINYIREEIIQDITKGDISNIYNRIWNYSEIVEKSNTFKVEESKEIEQEINKIPDAMLNSCLRNGANE